jgi:hypothetical protein
MASACSGLDADTIEQARAYYNEVGTNVFVAILTETKSSGKVLKGEE